MNKMNLAELLKDCASGVELYSPLFGDCKFVKVHDYEAEIIVEIETGANVSFKTDGRYYDYPNAECLLFPKGKTTWEGFVPPCQLEDGKIVATNNGLFIGIIKVKNNRQVGAYCSIDYSEDFRINSDYWFERMATEDEKQKLFQAIKDNGYKWNEETKTLEKLIEPIFKVGDRIKNKNDKWLGTRTIQSYVVGIGYFTTINDWVRIEDQDEYELVPDIKPKFNVGDKVKSKMSKNIFTVIDIKDDVYIFSRINDRFGYHVPFRLEKDYELVHRKFDINTLKPFESRVLMRSSNAREWVGTMYSHYNNNKFYGCGMCCDQCIPYEGNEDLLGTTDDCDEYFKIWE